MVLSKKSMYFILSSCEIKGWKNSCSGLNFFFSYIYLQILTNYIIYLNCRHVAYSLFQALSSWGWTKKKKGLSKRINEGGLRKWRKWLLMWKTVDHSFHYKNRLWELQKPLSQELDILGRFLASSLALEYQGNIADSHQRWNTIGPDHACPLSDRQ